MYSTQKAKKKKLSKPKGGKYELLYLKNKNKKQKLMK